MAPPLRLKAIEGRCLDWRWRLKGRDDRLVRTHGDFHPFNLVFDDASELSLLDASRGCVGDAADDLTALSINYLFFALQSGHWNDGYRALWRAFWDAYLQRRDDHEAVHVAPPFFTWRALVLANPTWYPDIAPTVRDALLRFAETALDAKRFELEMVEELFA